MTFKDHFSGHANIYREARPTYPDSVFEWLAGQSPGCELAWDAGCGNGQASVALAAHFLRVVATDPSVAQIANAIRHSRVEYQVEPAEQCSLSTRSVDLVTVAQALHWFDLDRFYAEVRRVLKPGGVVAALTYADCQVGAAVDVIKNHLYTNITGPYWPPERASVESGYRDLPFPFQELSMPSFPMFMLWDVDQFLAYLRSWSGTQRYIKAKDHDPVVLIEPELRTAWGEDKVHEVRWNLLVRVGRIE